MRGVRSGERRGKIILEGLGGSGKEVGGAARTRWIGNSGFLRVRIDSECKIEGRVGTEGDKPCYLGIFERADRFMEDLNLTAPPKGLYDLNVIKNTRLATEPDQHEPSVAVGPKYSIDSHDHCMLDSKKDDVSIPSHMT